MMQIDFAVNAGELSLAELPEGLRPLQAYWDQRRGARRMPILSEIDPVDLRPVLGRVSLIRVRPESPHFEFRVIGTHVPIWRGGPREGVTIADIEPPSYRTVIEQHYERVRTSGVPHLHEINLALIDRRFTYRRLLLPLGDQSGVSGLLAGSWFDVNAQAIFFDAYERALQAADRTAEGTTF